MSLNNEIQAVVARRDPSKSHNPEITRQYQQVEITAKMAKASNRSYKTAWKGFKKIVDDGHRAGTIDLGEHYITKDNIDSYFVDVVSRKTNVTADTCSWYRSTIQWFADNHEHIGRNFIVQ
eukprot:2917480-Ditylum_brightwellii.AAC.1